jgi:hypothetical protein
MPTEWKWDKFQISVECFISLLVTLKNICLNTSQVFYCSCLVYPGKFLAKIGILTKTPFLKKNSKLYNLKCYKDGWPLYYSGKRLYGIVNRIFVCQNLKKGFFEIRMWENQLFLKKKLWVKSEQLNCLKNSCTF